MAKQCFCGCGRTVRFATKKASKFGESTTRLLDSLNEADEKSEVELSDRQRQIVEELKSEGVELRGFWQRIAHGEPAPPTADGMRARQSFHRWEKDSQAAIRVLTGVSPPA